MIVTEKHSQLVFFDCLLEFYEATSGQLRLQEIFQCHDHGHVRFVCRTIQAYYFLHQLIITQVFDDFDNVHLLWIDKPTVKQIYVEQIEYIAFFCVLELAHSRETDIHVQAKLQSVEHGQGIAQILFEIEAIPFV